MVHQVLVSHLVGGAGMVAIRLAAGARRRAVNTQAWVPDRGPASNELDRLAVPWSKYDLGAMRGSNLQHILACGRMLPGLGWQRPIVHVHNPVVYRFIRPALVAARARVVVHFQIEPTAEEIEWTLRYPPDHVVTCARYIATRIEAVLGNKRNGFAVTAVPNAVDLQRFTPGASESARQRLGLTTDRFVVVLMANLAPHKGQVTAIRAMQVLKSRGLPVECWLVGEDRKAGREFEAHLRALCAELDVFDVVRFLGFQSEPAEILRAADVFILPSTHEGLPLSLVEAQAVRIPVIGSPIPGILEVVNDGRTGFIVPAADHTGYADRIQTLLEHPELCRQVTENAAGQVQDEYDWTKVEEKIFSIYASL